MSKSSKAPSADMKNETKSQVAEPHNLSSRSQWLRDYYFKGNEREWNNEYLPFITGAPWGERVWNECDFYVAPETMGFMGVKGEGPYGTSLLLSAHKVEMEEDFWELSLPERHIVFFREIMLNHIPQEIISANDLLAGGRFNTQLSKCLNEKECKAFKKRNLENRHKIFRYHIEGFGNLGATGGHIIPDHETVINKGFKYLYQKAKSHYNALSNEEKNGPKGNELRAMMISAKIPKELAKRYRVECERLLEKEKNPKRQKELKIMIKNLKQVPWCPARTFWEGMQALWFTHMLIMAEESYPGPGTSFGRIDQILYPLYRKDVFEEKKLSRHMAKEIFGSFIFHCNTAYDAQIRIGRQGITSGFGQLMTLSGMGSDGEDLTNELTYMILETFDEWAPILEPKPNIRLHRGSPEKLLDIIVEMIGRAQGAPFILNFDEKSIAGLIREGIPEDDAWNYGCVGCLENTLCGNDRSGTVNCNPNLAKSIELTLWNGKNQPGFERIFGQEIFTQYPSWKRIGPKTGKPESFETWNEFFEAWKQQIKFIINYTVETYNKLEAFRAEFLPTPYLSILMRDCIEKGVDIRSGPPEYGFVTIEGVGFATVVDSLLAIKKYIYEEGKYSIAQVKEALKSNYQGKKEYRIMRALFKNRAPKYGNDNKEADELARKVMKIWSDETWKYKTPTNYQFRPGMLSWNYWAGEDAGFTPATPDGRLESTFLSNAICPNNGADLNGPTAVTNSVGYVLGGTTQKRKAQDIIEYNGLINYLPNGASHTITFNPSSLRDDEHKRKFKAYLRSYVEKGGTALQINMLDAEMLKDAQKNPQDYENLLVRVTGYNAFFNAIGKELQDEIIARESHNF